MFDDNKVRDFGNWERKGPLASAQGPPPSRDGGRMRSIDGPRERRDSPAWGERSQDGSGPPRREYVGRPPVDRQPTAPDMDSQWRNKMKPDASTAKSPLPTPEASTPTSPTAPTVRPRLNLQKRTVSEAPTTEAGNTPSSDSKASPFGAARPIDTAARDRELEEKRDLAIRQKKEQDEKAKQEKRLEAEAAVTERTTKSAQPQAAPVQENGKHVKPDSSKDDENENLRRDPANANANANADGNRQYEILRKTGEGENGDPSEGATLIDGDANGTIIDDKQVKPKEVVRDAPANGQAPREKSPTPAAAVPPEVTAENLEDEGWSTVSKDQKKRRGGNQAARAIAS